MKNYALILLLISVSCNQQDREPKQHKITTQPNVAITKKQKYAQIEALFSKHDGYDHLNITYFEEDNYIQIAASTSTNEFVKFEYIEELFWWDNTPYFNEFLLGKIQRKLDEMTRLKHKVKQRKEPLKMTINFNNSKSSSC